MTPEKLYEASLAIELKCSLAPEPKRFMALRMASPHSIQAHARWLCVEARKLLGEGRNEKAMRALSFAQGALWAIGCVSIDDCRMMLMPDGAVFEKRSDHAPVIAGGCGDPACGVSTGIDGILQFGKGDLDPYGYWQQPCERCKSAWVRSGLLLDTNDPEFAAQPRDAQ